MTALSIVELIASIASLLLAIVAIWLALYFYTQSKNTETVILTALENIKTQSTSLEKLTGRWMDRLTRFATDRTADETTTLLIGLVREHLQPLSNQFQEPDQTNTKEELTKEVIICYIAIYYYSGLTNIASQGHLHEQQELAEEGVKNIIDSSYQDFLKLENILNSVDQVRLNASVLYHLYADATNNIKPYVRDTLGTYRARQAG